MMDYRVDLDVFRGPLDLLLYLVRKSEVDICDIPIAQITEQYVDSLKLLELIDLNLVGDFLVVASSLMEIKVSHAAAPFRRARRRRRRPAQRVGEAVVGIQTVQGRRLDA